MNRTLPTSRTRLHAIPALRPQYRAGRAHHPLALLVVAAALVLSWGIWASTAMGGSAGEAPSGSGMPYASDPRSDWRAGEVPRLYQTDPAWADNEYAGGTVAKNGCGPTCLSMVYVALTGRTDLGPAEMAAFSERGGYVKDGMTTWSLMTEGAGSLGLIAKELPAHEDVVRSALSSGSPVVCSVLPGDFTTTGHFIVLAGLADDGRVVVRDPNSVERTAQTWELGRVLGQCANLWAFSL